MAADPLRSSYEYCRELTRRTAHNFRYSFLTLTRDRYDAMCALYAFMRIVDDCGDDLSIPVDERRRRLQAWRSLVTSGFADSDHPAVPAIAETVTRFGIPPQYLQDVIAGVERDLQPVAIQTHDELRDYCYHVAGAVGLCCLHIWGFRDREAIPLGIDCGYALQLTNILRDVAEDFAAGRIYLPAEDLARFEYTPEDLAGRVCDDRFRALMAFECERAAAAYRQSEPLSALIDPVGRPILRSMREIYAGLLQEIVHQRYDVFQRRVSLPRWRKLWIAGSAWCRSMVAS